MKLIDEELGGTTPLDIIINFNDSDDLESFENLDSNDEDIFGDEDMFDEDIFESDQNLIWFTEEKIDVINDIHDYLDKREEIGKVQSIVSLIDMANLINKKPLDMFELSVIYNEIPEDYKKILFILTYL